MKWSAILKRLLATVPTLGLLVVLTFFLMRLAPGGPFDSEHVWPEEIQRNIEAKYGLDQPMPVQFVQYLGSLLHGDLKESFQYIGRPVSEMIGESLPTSLGLGTVALFLSLLIGIPLGAAAGWKKGSFWDSGLMAVAISGVSLPSYLVASILILVFSLNLGWFPPALWEGPTSWVLPAITLAVRPASIIARLTRTSIIDALHADYIRTAIAKGVHPARVLIRHALANSWIPILAVLGPIAANLVTGSFLVEVVFQIPGLGKYFVQAVLNRDYPLVMGVTLVYGVILLFCNLLGDILTAAADPRVRLDRPATGGRR